MRNVNRCQRSRSIGYIRVDHQRNHNHLVHQHRSHRDERQHPVRPNLDYDYEHLQRRREERKRCTRSGVLGVHFAGESDCGSMANLPDGSRSSSAVQGCAGSAVAESRDRRNANECHVVARHRNGAAAAAGVAEKVAVAVAGETTQGGEFRREVRQRAGGLAGERLAAVAPEQERELERFVGFVAGTKPGWGRVRERERRRDEERRELGFGQELG